MAQAADKILARGAHGALWGVQVECSLRLANSGFEWFKVERARHRLYDGKPCFWVRFLVTVLGLSIGTGFIYRPATKGNQANELY